MDYTILIAVISACINIGVFLNQSKTHGENINKLIKKDKEQDNYIIDINTRLILAERDIENAHNRINSLKDTLKQKGVIE